MQLLGEFRLHTADGETRELDSARAESLLAFLALNADARHSRQRLAGLLWPESSEAQARTNLRHLLHTMRRDIEDVDALITVTPRTVAWRGAGYRVDAMDFAAALDETATLTGADRLDALRTAVAEYPGDLLPSHDSDWVRTERERLRDRFCDALEDLGALLAEDRPAEAIPVLERLVTDDPLRESAYRRLIRVYQACGDHAHAVQTYHRCTAVLERELGVAPSEQTLTAYREALPAERLAAQVADQRVEAPLVGRAAERRALTDAWRTTSSGRAQLLLLTGEPGIGKTRLAEEFAAWAARHGAATATARAHAAEGALAYEPIAVWLRSAALRPGLDRLGAAHRVELARLLPGLGAATPEPLPPDEQRRRLFDAVTHAVRAAGRPLLLVADDAHWFDPESLRLIHYLLRTAADLPLLIVATARPEATAADHPVHGVLTGLRVLGQAEELALAALSADEVGALASRLGAAHGERLGELHAESEGNPLFVVEALRAGWPARRDLSPRVQAVIEARLAQLSEPSRRVLCVAATIGREFTTDVLAAACGGAEDEVLTALDELWVHRVVREQSGAAYDFAHDKIREVAYATTPPPRRRRYHRAVAEALGRAGAATPDELCGQIARHYLSAGAAEDAVDWTLRAADAAARLHSDAAAVAAVSRNVLALRKLPPTPGRERHELDLLTAVVGLVAVDEGFTSDRVQRIQERALELAGRLGVSATPPLIRSLAMTSLSGSDFPRAREYGAQLREAGERTGDGVLLVEGSYLLGIVAFWQGSFPAARGHFEEAIRRFRPEQRTTHMLRYGQDTEVVCQSRLANTLWFLGDPAAATAARDRALAVADDGGHPFTLATALTFAAILAMDMGDADLVRDYVHRLRGMRLEATAHLSASEALHGLVLVLDGEYPAGLRLIDQAAERGHRQPPVPGTAATYLRMRLAAAVAAGDRVEAESTARALLDCGIDTWRSLAEAVLRGPTAGERSWNAASATLR